MEKEQNNGSVHNSAVGSDVADDQAVATDISARDEYNPNWSKQPTNAHKALQVALHDVIQETLQDVVQQAVQDALDNHDFGDWVASALDNYDFESIVGGVIDNYDFDDTVGEILENYDFGNSALFSIVVGDVIEDRFGELFRQHGKRLYINCER